MVTCDVEMEDTDRQDFEVENSTVQDSESKCMDVDSQSSEGAREDIAAVDLVAGDVSKSQTEEEGVLEQRDDSEEEMVAKCEMKDLVGDKIESCDNEEVHKFNGEKISDIKDNKETQTDDQGQDASENMSQKQDDNNDVVEEKSVIDRVGEEMTGQNGAGGASRDVSTLEESHNGETADEKPKSTGRDEGDCIGSAAGIELSTENDVEGNDKADKASTENEELASKVESDKYSHYQNGQSDKVSPGKDSRVIDSADVNGSNVIINEPKEQNKVLLSAPVLDGQNYNIATVPVKHEGEDSSVTKQDVTSTPSSDVRYPGAVGEHGSETPKTVYTHSAIPLMAEDDDGTPEEQAAFMKEVESVYREKAIDFKPPKFYGQPLNCLKLWRAVIRLGGYDRVTASKLWRQVGESFHPPKTCTTVSWTFRIFYEKSLLEFERYKTQRGELQLPIIAFPEASGVDIEGNGNQGSGRVKRDAASRAMQGWHNQRHVTNGEGGEPVAKDKSVINAAKREREKAVKGSLKQKRPNPNEVEKPAKAARIEPSKQLAASIVDIGPPADWVKINIRETKDCFEVYALVPGLLREEVRVQSDPAGRLVITGQPEQTDNPWGITAFKKVVSLPGRIDPLLTSAVVSLHGRLFVRVPFEKPNNL